MKRNIPIFIAIGLILMTAVARIANHELHIYNLAPAGAIGLFGGAVLQNKRLAFIMPLLAMLLADVYIELFTTNPLQRGFYGIEQVFVYASLAVATLVGMTMKKINPTRVLGYSLTGSAIFFVLSNFGSFVSGMYGYSFAGLVKTYVMAIPFASNTFGSDLIFSSILFGSYYLLQQTVTASEPVKVKA